MANSLDLYVAVLSEKGLLPEDLVCVFAAGSLVRGWANDSSDLDVYVVTTGQWRPDLVDKAAVTLRPGTVPSILLFVGGRCVDVKYWSVDQVVELTGRIAWSAYDTGALDRDALSRADIEFLERLTHGVPAVGADWLADRRREVDNSALVTYVVRYRLSLADVFVEDAVGQMRSNDLECAVLSARAALGHAVDALLASVGEIGQSVKWRPKRFQSVEQQVLSFADYWRLETMESYDPDSPERWLDEVLKVCRHLALEITV